MKRIARGRKRQQRGRSKTAAKQPRLETPAPKERPARGGFPVSWQPLRSRVSVIDFASASVVMDEPKPAFLVEGILFPGAPFSLFGLPDSGKSLIALCLTVCVVAARSFFGRAVKPKRKPRTKNWYIRFYDANGKQHEKTGYRTKQAAKKALTQIEAAKDRGEKVSSEMGRITFDDAAKAVDDDYAINGRSTLDDVQRQIRLHLKPHFGGQRMTAITTDVITAYAKARQAEGAENASINRELSTLKRAFRLAVRAQKLVSAPYVPMLRENNARRGFFERDQIDAVLAKLPAFLRPPAVFCYWTGWRKAEVLSLQTRQVDLKAGVVRLEPGTTKNREDRQFHFGALRELRDTLSEQVAATERLSREHGRIVSHVFHRPDGLPIKSFRKVWARACREAGYPTMLVHDFRRTAVRNLERAGVPRSVAMSMVGHKTEAIYRRYAIVDEASHREAGEKYGAFASGKPAERQTAKVRQFKHRTAVGL